MTLATGEAAYILRTTRGAMTAVMDRPFVTFLRAKGVSQRRIVFGHALRNAGPSIVTVIGIQVGVLLGGAIIVETLFALPGVGRLLVTGISQRNYPTVQAGVLAIATIFILVSLVTDLIVGWLDPRIADGMAEMMGSSLDTTVTKAPRRSLSKSTRYIVGGGTVLAILIVAALAAPFIAPHDPDAMDVTQVLGAPSLVHPFGSDVLGRDVLSRVIFGLRASLRCRSRR